LLHHNGVYNAKQSRVSWRDYYDEFDASAWVEKGTLPKNADVMAYEGMINRPLFLPGEQYVYSNPA